MSTHAVLAVDAGRAATRAALVALSGQLLGLGRSGPGNPLHVDDAALAVQHIIEAVVGAIPRGGDAHVVRVVITLGGVMTPEHVRALNAGLAAHGIMVPVEFGSDVLAAYFSGTTQLTGAVLIVGTGAIAGRIVDGTLERVSDGLGWLLGDRGSGFWMGRQVAEAVATHLDNGTATAMTPDVLRALEIDETGAVKLGRPASLRNLTEAVYGRRPVELSRLAPIALQNAGSDPVASAIVDRAAAHLVASVRAVAPDRGPLVLVGGLMRPTSPLRDRVLRGLGDQRCLDASDALAGSVLMALRRAGAVSNQATHARLVGAIAHSWPST